MRGLRERGFVQGAQLLIDFCWASSDIQRMDVLASVVGSDTSTITHSVSLCAAALKQRMPTVFVNRIYLRAGGLIKHGPDPEAAFHRTAYFVKRLRKGARPADLPIEQTTNFQLVLR